RTLHLLPRVTQGILIIAVNTLLQRLPPPAYVAANTLELKLGQQYSIDSMRKTLEAAGYQCRDSVFEHGEFAVRGSIMDLFPMGSSTPYRIELFDDEIESLRTFSPDTQLSTEKVDGIRLLPGREYPLHQDAIARFRRAFREAFDVDVRRCPLYEDVSRGLASAGIEYYLPLFYDSLVSLFDYLPRNLQCLTYGEVNQGAELFWREIRSRYDERSIDKQRPILPPEHLFLSIEELFGALKPLPQLQLHTRQLEERAGHFN